MVSVDLVDTWQSYLSTVNDWKVFIKDRPHKQTACGPVYELANPIERANESFAIADMRNVPFAMPHYHHGETEIYFVLQGRALVVVGGEEISVQKETVVIIPPHTAHFVFPDEDLVLAVVNTPPFREENCHVLHESNSSVLFNHNQFQQLAKERNIQS